MTHWRKHIGPEERERALKATIEMALKGGKVKPSSVNAD